MTVTIDPNSGFCFGVVYAIQMAEQELDSTGTLYCLGDIVHNDIEVKRLTDKGLKIIDHDELARLKDATVLIRAHGEPPSTYITALENNITLLDASCPVVLKLQHRVKGAYDKLTDDDAQVVIFDIEGHAEVNGLMGQINGKGIIITTDEDLDKIDFSKPVVLFSQTTKSTDKLYAMFDKIKERALALGNTAVSMNDTICRQVSNREPQLEKFAAQHDVIIFAGGLKSSNGKVLYNVCKNVNPHSYYVSDENQLQAAWFNNAESVGIAGATSTPMWLMEQIAQYITTHYAAQTV